MQAIVDNTRTEVDYLAHVQSIIETDPNASKWHLVMNRINIHQSESLVHYIVEAIVT